jgi:hypothetical protein
MHPILKDRRSLSLYLFVWLALSVVLAALLAFPGKISITGAILFAMPLMLIYAFMSLSAWYVCRAFPLQSTNIVRLLGSTAAAALPAKRRREHGQADASRKAIGSELEQWGGR